MNVGGFTNIACSFAAADSKGNPCLGSTRSYNLDLMNDVLDTGEYNGEKITVKSLYITLANPVSVYAQQGYIEEAFSKIDFIVVADQSMTDTAKWADILLPAADWYEQSDMYAACGTPVSYTHLDVYKRQCSCCLCCWAPSTSFCTPKCGKDTWRFSSAIWKSARWCCGWP